jgi:hypothetical protein
MSEICKAMANILAKVDCIEKGRTNQHQGFKFRGIDDALNTLHGVFADEGVFLLHEVLEHSVTERSTAKGGVSFHHIVKVKFHFFCKDGSNIAAIGIGEAADTGDKGAGKAMSYALKVCLLQTFLIPTEEEKDPDASTTTWAPKQPSPVPRVAARQAEQFKQTIAFESRVDKAQAERELIQSCEAKMREEAKPADVFDDVETYQYEKHGGLVTLAAKELGITNASLKAHKEELNAFLSINAYGSVKSIKSAIDTYFSKQGGAK